MRINNQIGGYIMKQEFTSANTSINKNKLPVIYNRADIPSGSSVLDYGCGRHINHLREKAQQNNWTWSGFDPFNLPNSKPIVSDYVICSNVLNVIKEDSIVNDVITAVISLATKAAIFTVYEKDGTGKGLQTGKDQWQRNEKLSVYVKRMKDMGYNPIVKKGMIIVNG